MEVCLMIDGNHSAQYMFIMQYYGWIWGWGWPPVCLYCFGEDPISEHAALVLAGVVKGTGVVGGGGVSQSELRAKYVTGDGSARTNG